MSQSPDQRGAEAGGGGDGRWGGGGAGNRLVTTRAASCRMVDPVRIARPPRSRFAPPPPRRRSTLPLPALLIGVVILLIAYGRRDHAETPAATLDHVRVLTANTLVAGERHIRLLGIDAPEKAQTCRDAQGRSWACGVVAKQRLKALVAEGPVACAAHGHDRAGRTLAVCSAGPVADIGGALVREGYAVAYLDRDNRYFIDESDARDAGRGLWAGAFERPADWRRRQKPSG